MSRSQLKFRYGGGPVSIESGNQTGIRKEPNRREEEYQILTRSGRESASVIEQFCQTNGQILLPVVEMIESASEVVNSVIHEIALETIELLLVLSAEQVAGLQTQGKASVGIRWYGTQSGRVALADRKIRVRRPRLHC